MAPDGSQDLPQIPELEEEYEIVKELGRGGTAVVYLARERELGRDVAIKLIRPSHLRDEEAVARLVREARTVGKLQHPNIVMLLGTRRLDEGGLALILQFVPGRTLKERIREEGPLPFGDVERILRDLGQALSYAHRRRIVHRDIKPENVYLDDDAGVARLADFGIARAWDSDSGLTLPGTAIGTPTYMSPEQVDGRDLDGRSDLYSLGLLGWEMLTGRQPWAGESLYSVIYKQKSESLPPAGQIRANIPENVERAIEGALPKDPNERWPDADTFLEALSHGSDLPAQSPQPTRNAPEFFDRHARPASPDSRTIRYVRPDAPAEGSDGPAEGQPIPPVADRLDAIERLQRAQRQQALRDLEEEPTPSRPRRWAAAVVAVLLGGGLVFASLFAAPDGAINPFGDAAPAVPGTGGETGEAAGPVDGLPPGLPEGTEVSEQGETASVEDVRRLVPLSEETLEALAGASVPGPVQIRVEDEDGAPLAGIPVAFVPGAESGSAEPAEAVTDDAGTVSTEWTLGLGPGEQELRATVPDAALPPVTVMARALPRTPARVEVVAGADLTAPPGQPLSDPPVVQVVDAEGVGVARHWIRFTVAEGSGSLTTDSTQTDLQGFARVNWELGPEEGRQALLVQASGGGDSPETLIAVETAAPPLGVRGGVVAGGTHTCLLQQSGALTCWGDNGQGQLGGEGVARRLGPGPVVQGGPFARVTTGLTHTCALTPDGTALCWGANDRGQLGNGTTSAAPTPTPVAGELRFTDIQAGAFHTCGLARGGAVHCWGANEEGQLGNGSRQASASPVQADFDGAFRSLAVGWRHTCALSTGGRPICWGANSAGALGRQDLERATVPAPVSGGFTFTALAAGNAHTCGLTAAGRVFCWGENSGGQLGDDTRQGRAEPVEVAGSQGFTALAAGALHTCAVNESGAAYCWGRNVYGQVGDGSTTDRLAPVAVEGSYRFQRIHAFGSHTCGSTPGGDVLCWGYNAEGQLGDGSREHRARPVLSQGG